jgi:uncharacterized membrane protein YfcA
MESSSSHQSSSVTPPLEQSSQHTALGDEDRTFSRPPLSIIARVAAACFLLAAVACTQQHVSTSSRLRFFLEKNAHNRNLKPDFDSSSKIRSRKQTLHLRRLEDGDGQKQEEQAAEDGDEEEQQDEEQNGPGNDDFFDDYIQDDLVAADNGSKGYDDFYVFEKSGSGPPRLLPLTTKTIVGFFVAALALGIGASSGTGGGGTIVPIYILISELPIQVAIPIGAVTVLGGAIASTSLNWTRRHPLADRVLIDWDIVLVMEPLTLAGALLGTLFHRLLSEKVLLVMLILLLSITAHTTLSKAMRMYQAEIRYIRHLRAAQSEPPIDTSPSSLTKTDTWGGSESESLAGRPRREPRHLDAAEKEAILILNPDFVTLRSELIQQEKFTPRSKIIALCCMFSVLIFLNIMVGGGAYKSPWDIDCNSVAFWTVHVIMIAFLIASAWAAHSYVVARFEIKQLVRFDYVHGDIKWDTRSAFIYPAVFVTAGLFAGTLGIGGGSELISVYGD